LRFTGAQWAAHSAAQQSAKGQPKAGEREENGAAH
jgi:hypothetical protein